MDIAPVKSFTYHNTAEELYPLSLAIVDYIKQEKATDEEVIRKVKLVLMELLTNSLKHCGGGQTDIGVALTGRAVTLTRLDTGNPIAITTDSGRLEWPLPGNHHAGRDLYFYGDGSGRLMGGLKNNCLINFYIEPTDGQHTDILQLPEHFGLMIIALACTNFEYEFDINTCTNKFTAVIALTEIN